MKSEAYVKRPYSLDERLKIRDMLSDKRSVGEISQALGRTVYAIGGELRRRGTSKKDYDPYFSIDKENSKKPYSLEERNLLADSLSKGMTRVKIAKLLNRSTGSVSHEIRNHGGHYGYDPIKAHDGFKLRCQPIVKKDLVTRIENLEMQLEIITTTLQEILDGQNNKL